MRTDIHDDIGGHPDDVFIFSDSTDEINRWQALCTVHKWCYSLHLGPLNMIAIEVRDDVDRAIIKLGEEGSANNIS